MNGNPNDNIIIGSNGVLYTQVNPNITVLYVLSFATGTIVKVTLDSPDATSGIAEKFLKLPGITVEGGILSLINNGIQTLDEIELYIKLFLPNYSGKIIDGINELFKILGNYIPPGPVSILPFPSDGNFFNPSSFMVCCRLSSQILKVDLDKTIKVLASSDSGIRFPAFALPNSFSLIDYQNIFVTNTGKNNSGNNNVLYKTNEVPTIIKLDLQGNPLQFIPLCVLNFFTKNVRGLHFNNGYLYIGSTGNKTIVRINLNGNKLDLINNFINNEIFNYGYNNCYFNNTYFNSNDLMFYNLEHFK